VQAAVPKNPSVVPVAAALASVVAIAAAAYFVGVRGGAPPPRAAVAPAAAPAAPAKPPPRMSVNLLSGADTATGVLRGTWRREGGDLRSEAPGLAVFSLGEEPPDEYDVRVEFTPLGAEPDINVIGIWDRRPFQWYVGSQGSTWYGFGWIDGQTGFGHPSGLRRAGLMKTGQRHTTLLEVRRDRISGVLDGKTLVVLAMEGHTLNVTEELLPRDRTRLALVTYNNPTIFHAVELIPR